MRFTVGLIALWLLVGCGPSEDGLPHPPNVLDYPVAVTADPSGSLVWVTSGNFDLAWRGGAVLAMDVTRHDFIYDDDERPVAAQVGGMPGPVQILSREGRADSLYVLSRTTDALYHLSLEGQSTAPILSCEGGTNDGSDSILECPHETAITDIIVTDTDGEERDLTLGEDPYGLLLFRSPELPGVDLLLTASMGLGGTSSQLTLFQIDDDGAPIPVDSISLSGGLVSMAAHPITGRIYTSHKLINSFHVLEVQGPRSQDLNPAPQLQVVDVLSVPFQNSLGLVESHGRELAISPDGQRLYAAFRSPASLVVVNLGEDDEGADTDRVVGKIPLSGAPGDLLVAPATGDLPELVYVSSFGSDQIDVVDPIHGVTVDSIPTGRGPYGMTLVEEGTNGLRRLYVSLFYDHALGVIELNPQSPYLHSQIAEVP
ncbi:MAG: hypothetical protein VX938_05030 [Myxococcota bacterium]|nr:hypothetical protein [Myxococcota bacterium]